MVSEVSAKARFVLPGAHDDQTLGSAMPEDKSRCLSGTEVIGSGWRLEKMNSLPAVLVCDSDTAFREALRNFLLAAGYPQVEVAATIRAALVKLRREYYGYVLIGVSRTLAEGRRLATVAQWRQPEAKIFILVGAKDQPFIKDASFETVIKEYVYSNLLELM